MNYQAKSQTGAPIAQYAKEDAERALRISELRNARAVFCTLAGHDLQVKRIGIELQILGVA